MKKEFKIAANGHHIDVSYFVPEGKTSFPFVILSHGFGGAKIHHEADAEFLSANGYGALALTFPGGSRDFPGDFPTTKMSILTEKEDLTAVLRWAQQQPEIEKDKIFLFGASQGGIVSALTGAAFPEEIRGLMLLYPALCIPDGWNERYASEEECPEVQDFWGVALGRAFWRGAHAVDVFSEIPKFTGPVLLMHGTDDQIVPISYSERAAQLYQNSDYVIFAGEPHGFSPEGNLRVQGQLLYFLSRVLR